MYISKYIINKARLHFPTLGILGPNLSNLVTFCLVIQETLNVGKTLNKIWKNISLKKVFPSFHLGSN